MWAQLVVLREQVVPLKGGMNCADTSGGLWDLAGIVVLR
jgi:hypothetical protein